MTCSLAEYSSNGRIVALRRGSRCGRLLVRTLGGISALWAWHHSGDDQMTKTNDQDTSFGDQVNPATQTREDDGNRTLATPKTDPGPVLLDSMPNVRHPDKLKDEKTIRDANPDGALNITQRTSTEDHSKRSFGKAELHPDLVVNGAASDMYHKEGREEGSGLTDQAMKNNREQSRVASPHRDTEQPEDDAPKTA